MDTMTGEDAEVLPILPVTQHLFVCEYKNTLNTTCHAENEPVLTHHLSFL